MCRTQLILIFSFLSFSIVCFSADNYKIIGKNDLIEINSAATNIPFRFRKLLHAFGATSDYCTATHIGRGYVLTAGHCFWAPPEMTPFRSCEGTTISWGLLGDKKPNLISDCTEIIAVQQDQVADFALIKVSPIPDVFISPELKNRTYIGDTLTAFSHPLNLSLHWSTQCGVERQGHPMLPPKSLHHKCDTNPGSSGAALLNILTLRIVGIHNGGFNEDEKLSMNYGTYITDSPLYEILKNHGFISYPSHWWDVVPDDQIAEWEIPPQAGSLERNEVVLSKRNELGQFSNLAAIAFSMDGKYYASLEAFWQAMKYPESENDERLYDKNMKWPYTRAQVMLMSGFESKKAGTLANENMKKLGIKWLTYNGEKIEYNGTGKERHYDLILQASKEKIAQNQKLKELLLSTGDLMFLPDHKQRPDSSPAYLYHQIYFKIREELKKVNRF